MNTRKIIHDLGLVPSKEEKEQISGEVNNFCKKIKDIIKEREIKAEVFVGGSVAKETFVKKDKNEVDIFVRFYDQNKDVSKELGKIVKIAERKIKVKNEKLHGSRDYFRFQTDKITFELIPVIKIKKPQEAKNITDLSYFHVNYIKKNLNEKIINEILIAKAFFKAQGVYGAESYIQGFSGYAIECLMIYYKTFERMIKDFIKKDKITIDIKKFYKNKDEIRILLNESKTKSPIILIDPTWKERNVLAALSYESYDKIKNAAEKYLKNKEIKYFEDKPFNIEEFKSKLTRDSEFIRINLQTNKQPGDIAGTKMKKFYKFIKEEISKEFEIIESNFEYYNSDEADIFLIVKSRGEVIKNGPPLNMPLAVEAFKKNNEETFVNNGKIYSRVKISYPIQKFLDDWSKKYNKKLKEMDIINIKIN